MIGVGYVFVAGKRKTAMVLAALVLVWALIPPVQSTSPRSRHIDCGSNMRNIATALLIYHDRQGHFPPAYTVDQNGNRLHSWRTLILPYLDGKKLYDKIRLDEPWNSPYNSQFHSEVLPLYCCPSSINYHQGYTPYVAVIGDNTAWRGDAPGTLDSIRNMHGQTILIVECEDAGIHWMEPRDIEFDKMSMQVNPQTGVGISSPHQRWAKRGLMAYRIPGANVAFVDRSVEFLTNDTPPEEIRAMLMIDDSKP
jgi:hypothetical protein